MSAPQAFRTVLTMMILSSNVCAAQALRVDFDQSSTLRPDMGAENLVTLFGAKNVKTEPKPMAEGTESKLVTTIFEHDPERHAVIHWKDEGKRRGIEGVQIYGTAWKTKNDLKVGMTLDELTTLNGAPLKFSGFGWDFSGQVSSYCGGKLNTSLTAKGHGVVSITLGQGAGGEDDKLLGDLELLSSQLEVKKNNPHIVGLFVWFDSNMEPSADAPCNAASPTQTKAENQPQDVKEKTEADWKEVAARMAWVYEPKGASCASIPATAKASDMIQGSPGCEVQVKQDTILLNCLKTEAKSFYFYSRDKKSCDDFAREFGKEVSK